MTLTKSQYKIRVIDSLIAEKLKTFGAVCIEGPKWCGKTWTALNHAESVVYIGDPKNNFQNRTMASISPDLVLQGKIPHLIDEWQEVPSIWDAVRFKVDQSHKLGQFILTGSSTPKTKGIMHSGTGRIDRIRMRPMSLYESGDSSGIVSLAKLFDGVLEAVNTGDISIQELIRLTTRGGWPGSIELSDKQAFEIPKSYLRSVIDDDFGINREKKKVKYLLQSLARNESTLASNSTLRKDIHETESETVDTDTISSYLDILNRMFLIEDQPAYDPNFRSSTRIAKSPKRHFIDPSLAIAALELSPQMLLSDLNLFGFMFESLVIRDLRIYAEGLNGRVFHYRNHNSNKEIDAIIELQDGKWGIFEIKLGVNQIEEAAKNLLDHKVMFEKLTAAKAPTILCVICGLTNIAYQRDDGIFVIPITALKM